jgi:hypothetical protein
MNPMQIINMINQFNQFKSSFTGDPRQQVQQLLNNGKMSQNQLNQLMQMANQFQNLLPK